MKYFFPLVVTAAISATLFSSCKKHKEDEETPNTATISISNPQANDTISGASFQITGSIVSTANIHGYDVKLTKVSDGTQVFAQDIDVHSTNTTVDVAASPTGITEGTQLKLLVTVVLDHEGNQTTKEVVFHYIP